MTADAAWRFHRRAHTTDILRPWAAVATELLAIQPATERLTVLHRDGLVVSALYDSPTTLHYFDPPYLGFDGVYQHRFGQADHQRLADAAHRRTGRGGDFRLPDPGVRPLVSRLVSVGTIRPPANASGRATRHESHRGRSRGTAARRSTSRGCSRYSPRHRSSSTR